MGNVLGSPKGNALEPRLEPDPIIPEPYLTPGNRTLGFLFDDHQKAYPINWSWDMGIPDKHIDETWVTIMLGSGLRLDGAGGKTPYVTLWDDEGKRVGQHWPADDAQLWNNDKLSDKTFKIQHAHARDKMVTAKYVMISLFDGDGLCLSAVQVSNGLESTTWYGDMGQYCGMQWYLSERKLGHGLPAPKCVWLATDLGYSSSLHWHVPDVYGTRSKLAGYLMDQQKYMCHSTPRFAEWRGLTADGIIPFFKPVLQYEVDAETGLPGRDKTPEDAVDKIQWNKNANRFPSPHFGRSLSSTIQNETQTSSSRKRGFNPNTGHLIITEQEGHEASLVCNSTTSYGWDVVSLRERKYCDMTVRKLYHLCDSGRQENCFDVDKEKLVGKGGINARGEVSLLGVPEKRYTSRTHWKHGV
ncbi:hypothetical protein Cob_v010994 [Colletotrichum orbiculare MAFF 240422]|uniref:Uncharacterized protein n=1 Tax=Colletotrichum orbiculare (strain 104-T / ATCC 96160 / CBS 514.97 / LARS 414 / MAFF 240422) TaxID=1213857 RepID=A0A484FES5_COLOR|nr:hypothetical protein Cob_v010994 [Colletotrichum orbiculare MAFF 240422]